jgi:flagellar hook protein FlgE
MNITSVALTGMDMATTKLQSAANRIAGAADPQDSVDLSAEMVALLEARNEFAVNARVVHTADQMQANLLDILA